LKAYRTADGGASLFRPDANARRFANSARRMAMAEVPTQIFMDSLRELVRIDHDWIPDNDEGSLYLRPFMFASEVFLGVKPASEYLYVVIASPAGPYFKGGIKPLSLWVSEEYTRAAPGGTGAAKCGGNYAASLSAQAEAIEYGCDQVVFLDAVERKYVDELGGMNTFFVFDDNTMVTPPLTGSILPGITRDAIMTLAAERGIETVERPYSIDEWRDDATSGRMTESFACGTAAVMTPIGRVRSHRDDFTIGAADEMGPVTAGLRKELVDIQRGLAEDRHGWVQRVI
jgi:branched-chain amino acid aminotransferase